MITKDRIESGPFFILPAMQINRENYSVREIFSYYMLI